jgi:hypothetical protein
MEPNVLAEKMDNLIELQAETNRLLQRLVDQYNFPILVRVEQERRTY